MTTAPITVDDLLDFEITDPGTIKDRAPRLRVVRPRCGTCEPSGAARALLAGAEVYSSCIVCETAPEPSTP